MEYSLSEDSEGCEIENNYQERSSNGLPLCRGCFKEIHDKYYLRVNEASWHEECLKCSYCSTVLISEETCFIKKRQILCKIDYYKNFGIKCTKCTRNIQSSDWVRRAKDNVYHLACFACDSCKRQLSTGEEFALHNNKLLCKTHYCESIDGDNSGKEGENSKAKNKRVRTTFTEEQLQVLQANFEVDSNPDGQDLERIAQITGLSKRVTQVWFQNSRARQKKYKEKKIGAGEHSLDLNEASNDDIWNSELLMVPKKKQTISNSFENSKSKNKEHKQIKNKNGINNEGNINLSWSSDDSIYDEANENSIYDSSFDLNQDND